MGGAGRLVRRRKPKPPMQQASLLFLPHLLGEPVPCLGISLEGKRLGGGWVGAASAYRRCNRLAQRPAAPQHGHIVTNWRYCVLENLRALITQNVLLMPSYRWRYAAHAWKIPLRLTRPRAPILHIDALRTGLAR